MKILVVDDKQEDRAILKQYLVPLESDIFEAVNGVEGLKIAGQEQPDLIISDILMPNVDGFAFLREIRRSDELRATPFIFYSAVYKGCREQKFAMALGADAFFTKPLKSQDFIDKLQILLKTLDRSKRAASHELLQKNEAFYQKYSQLVKARLEHNVRELESTNRRLVMSEARYRNLFTSLRDVVIIGDLERTIVDVNQPAFHQMFGYERDEIAGKSSVLLYANHGEFQRVGIEVFDHPEASARKVLEARFKRKSGEVFYGEMSAFKMLDDSGNPIGNIGVIRDITDRKKIDEEKKQFELQLLQTQKMESLGIMAGGIAHDFNNILTVIICNCSLAQQHPETAAGLIPEIETAAQRAADLCRQMLVYSGKALLIMRKINMAELVRDMVGMLRSIINQNVEISFKSPPEAFFISGDASQMRQVVMNLVINASEAIGADNGTVSVSLAHTEFLAGHAVTDYFGKVITPGEYACLEIADNGCGMDEDTRIRVFEPFYTTKFTGRGLGMSAVLGIITGHKGVLQVISAPGNGTIFKIYLPLSIAASAAVEALLPAVAEEWQGDGTILLVEDEEQLLEVARSFMETLGFTVIQASNGKEALELYHTNSDSITMVVTDLGMPVMDGYDLFTELKKSDPELPIIISSGFGAGDVTSRIPPDETAGFLYKPYNYSDMQKTLKSVFEKTVS